MARPRSEPCLYSREGVVLQLLSLRRHQLRISLIGGEIIERKFFNDQEAAGLSIEIARPLKLRSRKTTAGEPRQGKRDGSESEIKSKNV